MPWSTSPSGRPDACRRAARASSSCATDPDGEQLTDGLLGAIFAGEAEIVNDVVADPRSSAAERAAMASVVAAPLRVRGERLGIIGTRSAAPLEFHASDLKVLTAIASLAAPTVDQARTHEAAVSGT